MKKIWLLLVLVLLVFFLISCQLSMTTFDEVNDHKGSVILNIVHDSVGTIDAYDFYILDTLGNYKDINIRPEYANLFNIGDTI